MKTTVQLQRGAEKPEIKSGNGNSSVPRLENYQFITNQLNCSLFERKGEILENLIVFMNGPKDIHTDNHLE